MFKFLSLILISGVAMAVNEPKYSIESQNEHFEIRSYGSMLVAETVVDANFDQAGNQAFRILADYIFGNNKNQKKIEMTAPVAQQAASVKIEMTAPVNQIKDQQGQRVQFVMPEEYKTLESLPQPNDPRVQLRQLSERKVAVYSYSGSWSESRYKEKLSDFKTALEKAHISTIGEPIFARFNSPLKFWFLRRNEIWFEVAH